MGWKEDVWRKSADGRPIKTTLDGTPENRETGLPSSRITATHYCLLQRIVFSQDAFRRSEDVSRKFDAQQAGGMLLAIACIGASGGVGFKWIVMAANSAMLPFRVSNRHGEQD